MNRSLKLSMLLALALGSSQAAALELGQIQVKSALGQPLLAEIIALVPRLAVYPARFADALAGLKGGDRAMMARPLIDSYHTVWFELHEDLIALSGTTRAVEAAAGRGD